MKNCKFVQAWIDLEEEDIIYFDELTALEAVDGEEASLQEVLVCLQGDEDICEVRKVCCYLLTYCDEDDNKIPLFVESIYFSSTMEEECKKFYIDNCSNIYGFDTGVLYPFKPE